MIDFHIRLHEEQLNSLQALLGTPTDHIRRAIDEYLVKMRNKNVSGSQSERRQS